MVPVLLLLASRSCAQLSVPMPLGAHVLGRAFSDVAIRFLVLGRGSRFFIAGGAHRDHLAADAPGVGDA